MRDIVFDCTNGDMASIVSNVHTDNIEGVEMKPFVCSIHLEVCCIMDTVGWLFGVLCGVCVTNVVVATGVIWVWISIGFARP